MSEDWREIQPIYISINDFIHTIAQFVIYQINYTTIFSLILAGIIYLAIKDKLLLYILIAPIILNLFAQLFNIYPFPTAANYRTVLYITPLIMVFSLKSLEFFLNFIKKKAIYNFLFILIIFFVLKTELNTYLEIKIYVENDYYYFIKSNSKIFIDHLAKKQQNTSDIIVINKKEGSFFDIYSNNKYKKNTIFIDKDFSILDKEKNKNFWFYIGCYHYEDNNYNRLVKNWIKENCEIIIQEKDENGELFYVKKIK